MNHRADTHECQACSRHVSPNKPSPLWAVAHGVAWLYCAAMILGAAMIGTGVVPMVPVMLAIGLGLIGGTGAEAFRPHTCPNCHRRIATAGSVKTVTLSPSRAFSPLSRQAAGR